MWRGQVKEEDRAKSERQTEESNGDVKRGPEGGRQSGERKIDEGEQRRYGEGKGRRKIERREGESDRETEKRGGEETFNQIIFLLEARRAFLYPTGIPGIKKAGICGISPQRSAGF